MYKWNILRFIWVWDWLSLLWDWYDYLWYEFTLGLIWVCFQIDFSLLSDCQIDLLSADGLWTHGADTTEKKGKNN